MCVQKKEGAPDVKKPLKTSENNGGNENCALALFSHFESIK